MQRDGYGITTFHRRFWLTHRLAWHLANGEIPLYACVCHLCDNPRCCTPGHLFIGSHAENMADMQQKGRRLNVNSGERNGRAKLTQTRADAIRFAYQSGFTQATIADEFNVSQSTVSLIVRGEHW